MTKISTPVASVVQMRVIIIAPPPGVLFALQRGSSELLLPSVAHAELLQFDFTLRVGSPLSNGAPNFLGEYAQGPATDRFIYLNSGTLAGQEASPWTHRAKLKLASIPRELAEAAIASPDQVIEARIRGTLPNGSPVHASLKPDAVEWSLAP